MDPGTRQRGKANKDGHKTGVHRNVPVHPEDRLLLGMKWEEDIFVDAALPFGLRSAPLIFSALADLAQWVMQERGVKRVAHYIDDFVSVSPPDGREGEADKSVMHDACEDLGLPTKPEKDEGPAPRINFLGLELDSQALVIKLPLEKLHSIKAALTSWKGRKSCRKQELLSLIGILMHASRAVRAGRSFLRQLIDLSMTRQNLFV